MKKLLLSATALLLPLNIMAATVFGAQVGAGSWTHTPSGSITSSVGGVGTSADLVDDLQLSEKAEGYTYVIIEHPIPMVPNFKYVNTALTSGGSGKASVSFTFNNQAISTTTAITTSLDLSQNDIILYYELLDNVVSFDFGLNFKTLDGKVAVDSISSPFSATIPLGYVAVEMLIPDTGIAIGAEMNTLGAAGNKISDSTIKASYTTDFNLGLEAGYRTQEIIVDVSKVKTNIKFSGIFFGAFFKF